MVIFSPYLVKNLSIFFIDCLKNNSQTTENMFFDTARLCHLNCNALNDGKVKTVMQWFNKVSIYLTNSLLLLNKPFVPSQLTIRGGGAG